MTEQLQDSELKLLYQEKYHLIQSAVAVYTDGREGDPHKAFADKIGVDRNTGKALFYVYLFTDQSWFASNYRIETYKEVAYLSKLNTRDATHRREIMDEVDNFARIRERTRKAFINID